MKNLSLVLGIAIFILVSGNAFAQENPIDQIYWHLQRGEFESALSIFEENSSVYGMFSEYYWLWSSALLMAGKSEEAVLKAKEAFSMRDPNFLDYRRIAIILKEAGYYQEAIDNFKMALEYEPKDMWATYHLAMILSEISGDKSRISDEAISYWLKLEDIYLQGQSIPTLSFYYIAEAHNILGDIDLALSYFERFVLEHESMSVRESEFLMRAISYLQRYRLTN